MRALNLIESGGLVSCSRLQLSTGAKVPRFPQRIANTLVHAGRPACTEPNPSSIRVNVANLSKTREQARDRGGGGDRGACKLKRGRESEIDEGGISGGCHPTKRRAGGQRRTPKTAHG